jgi:catechol 2,3-dioxygenase-like lactoylglutathione lyase family enzyme
MLANADVMAFVATADHGRARGFYEGVLGLPVVEDDGLALAFAAHGTMLRVTGVRELTPPPYTVLGWSVPDALSGSSGRAHPSATGGNGGHG